MYGVYVQRHSMQGARYGECHTQTQDTTHVVTQAYLSDQVQGSLMVCEHEPHKSMSNLIRKGTKRLRNWAWEPQLKFAQYTHSRRKSTKMEAYIQVSHNRNILQPATTITLPNKINTPQAQKTHKIKHL